MSSMSIGQVAKICGLAPSAIRYYEKAGLLPKPTRISRQRRYGAEVIGRLRLIQIAREAGFTIAAHEGLAGSRFSVPVSEHRGLRSDHWRGGAFIPESKG